MLEREQSHRNSSLTKAYNKELSARENQMMGEPRGFDESKRVVMSSEETV
jgi:hypothetical protein